MLTAKKTKTCSICEGDFYPNRSTEKVCSINCAIIHATKARQRRDAKVKAKAVRDHRAETKRRREALKSRSDWLKEAQREFNKYIRLRDSDQPCISCGRFHDGQYHAGHYLSTGAHPELRFNEFNCHKQCAPCNNHLSGNQVKYREALVNKIGQDMVEFLEGPHDPLKPTIEELKFLKEWYRDRCKQLQREREE